LVSIKQGRRVRLLFATMADKEWELMLASLASVADELVFTKVAMERSADPRQLAEKLDDSLPHRVILDSREALRTLIDDSRDDDLIVVAGSLYLLGEVRPVVQEIASARASAASSSTQP
jgi:dihydrofolate synthase/folylpolyglutamate synthase